MSRFAKLAVFAALPAAVLSFCAIAQNAPATADAPSAAFQHMLQKMDTNGDGRISQEEFLAAASTRFKSLDTRNTGSVDATAMLDSPATAERLMHRAQFMVMRLDKAGNGYITKDEVIAAAQKRFTRMDRNGDGKLTPDELSAPRGRHAHGATPAANDTARAQRRAQFAQKRFDALDANHDGVVTQAEFVAAATTRFQQIDARGTGKVTASQIASSPQARERATRAVAHLVKRLDANGDGVVSQDEYLAAARKRFTRLDRNGDGFIDADELPAHHWARGRSPAPSGG